MVESKHLRALWVLMGPSTHTHLPKQVPLPPLTERRTGSGSSPESLWAHGPRCQSQVICTPSKLVPLLLFGLPVKHLAFTIAGLSRNKINFLRKTLTKDGNWLRSCARVGRQLTFHYTPFVPLKMCHMVQCLFQRE